MSSIRMHTVHTVKYGIYTVKYILMPCRPPVVSVVPRARLRASSAKGYYSTPYLCRCCFLLAAALQGVF